MYAVEKSRGDSIEGMISDSRSDSEVEEMLVSASYPSFIIVVNFGSGCSVSGLIVEVSSL